MRTVSFQGSRLTESDRRRLAQQQQARAFINPVLQQQVAQIEANLARLQADENRVDPYRYRLDYQAKGTPFVGDAFGF